MVYIWLGYVSNRYFKMYAGFSWLDRINWPAVVNNANEHYGSVEIGISVTSRMILRSSRWTLWSWLQVQFEGRAWKSLYQHGCSPDTAQILGKQTNSVALNPQANYTD
jgi:hypothetical protein